MTKLCLGLLSVSPEGARQGTGAGEGRKCRSVPGEQGGGSAGLGLTPNRAMGTDPCPGGLSQGAGPPRARWGRAPPPNRTATAGRVLGVPGSSSGIPGHSTARAWCLLLTSTLLKSTQKRLLAFFMLKPTEPRELKHKGAQANQSLRSALGWQQCPEPRALCRDGQTLSHRPLGLGLGHCPGLRAGAGAGSLF